MEREDFGRCATQDSADNSRVHYMKQEHRGAHLTTTMRLLLLYFCLCGGEHERQGEGGEEELEEGTRGGVRDSSETSPR